MPSTSIIKNNSTYLPTNWRSRASSRKYKKTKKYIAAKGDHHMHNKNTTYSIHVRSTDESHKLIFSLTDLPSLDTAIIVANRWLLQTVEQHNRIPKNSRTTTWKTKTIPPRETDPTGVISAIFEDEVVYEIEYKVTPSVAYTPNTKLPDWRNYVTKS